MLEKVTGLLRVHSAFSLVLGVGGEGDKKKNYHHKSSPSNRAVLGRKGQFGGGLPRAVRNGGHGGPWKTARPWLAEGHLRAHLSNLGKSQHK